MLPLNSARNSRPSPTAGASVRQSLSTRQHLLDDFHIDLAFGSSPFQGIDNAPGQQPVPGFLAGRRLVEHIDADDLRADKMTEYRRSSSTRKVRSGCRRCRLEGHLRRCVRQAGDLPESLGPAAVRVHCRCPGRTAAEGQVDVKVVEKVLGESKETAWTEAPPWRGSGVPGRV